MEIRNINIRMKYAILILLNIVLFFGMSKGGIAKYFFVLGVAGFVLLVMPKNDRMKDKLLLFLPMAFYILMGMAVCVFRDEYNDCTFKQPLFYLVPYLAALVISCYSKWEDDYLLCQFWGIVAVFLVNGLLHFSRTDLMESQYAFIIGVYVIYFFYKRYYYYFCISLPLMYLAHKRIVMAAVLAILAFLVVGRIIKNRTLKHFIIRLSYIGTALVMFLYVYVIKSGIYVSFMAKHNINTMGRANAYTFVAPYYEFSTGFWGRGMGSAQLIIKGMRSHSFDLLHNDILSLFIEIGFWGFMIFLVLYYIVISKLTRKYDSNVMFMIVALYIYTFINYMSDNISIYINYFFPLYMIIFTLLDETYREQDNMEIQ